MESWYKKDMKIKLKKGLCKVGTKGFSKLCAAFLLVGCQRHEQSGTPKLRFSVKESTVTSTGLQFSIKNSDTRKADWSFGVAYTIERQEENGWLPLDYITPEPPLWIMIGYSVKSGMTSKWDVDWTALYGELSPGTYRMAKEFTRTEGDTTEEYTLYAAFELK